MAKKYKKLTGEEVATPEALERGRVFMIWYGAIYEKLKHQLIYKGTQFDHDVAQDTALKIYKDITLKEPIIQDVKSYFFRAYRNAMKDKFKAPKGEDLEEVGSHLAKAIDAERQKQFKILRANILTFVRTNFEPFDCAIYELYEGLYPDTSYNRLAEFLNVSRFELSNSLIRTRAEIKKRYSERYDYLRSM